MTEYEICSLVSQGFGFGACFFVLVMIYWGQK